VGLVCALGGGGVSVGVRGVGVFWVFLEKGVDTKGGGEKKDG